MSRPIQEIGLVDLLPSNLTSKPNVSLVCTALDEQLQAVNDCLDRLSIWANLDNQPDEVLDLIAWENSVEGWSEELPKVEKFCEKNNLYCVRSGFKVILADEYAYSNKGIRISEKDKRPGMYFVYISKDEKQAWLASYYELTSNDYYLGLTLGYHPCCLDFF